MLHKTFWLTILFTITAAQGAPLKSLIEADNVHTWEGCPSHECYVFLNKEQGSYRIHVLDYKKRKHQSVVLKDKGAPLRIVISPDEQWISWAHNFRNESTYYMNRETGEVKLMPATDSPTDEEFTIGYGSRFFSPDSKYLLGRRYPGGDFVAQELSSGKTRVLKTGNRTVFLRSEDGDPNSVPPPVMTREGRILIQNSPRHYEMISYRDGSNVLLTLKAPGNVLETHFRGDLAMSVSESRRFTGRVLTVENIESGKILLQKRVPFWRASRDGLGMYHQGEESRDQKMKWFHKHDVALIRYDDEALMLLNLKTLKTFVHHYFSGRLSIMSLGLSSPHYLSLPDRNRRILVDVRRQEPVWSVTQSYYSKFLPKENWVFVDSEYGKEQERYFLDLVTKKKLSIPDAGPDFGFHRVSADGRVVSFREKGGQRVKVYVRKGRRFSSPYEIEGLGKRVFFMSGFLSSGQWATFGASKEKNRLSGGGFTHLKSARSCLFEEGKIRSIGGTFPVFSHDAQHVALFRPGSDEDTFGIVSVRLGRKGFKRLAQIGCLER